MQALDFDNESGLKVASFTEIREALQSDLKRIFGDSLNLAPSTPDGMLLDVFAYAYNALAQNLQAVITNLNVSTASGIFLDYLAEIAVGGRNQGESDVELIKRIQAADHYGYATYNGMLTYLQKYIGAAVGLIVNEEDQIDENGVPPHRFAVFVPEETGLTADEIAGHIWTCKPAGIKSHGSKSGEALAADGKHTVYYNQITKVDIYLNIEITEYTEEILPEDFAEQIKAAVMLWAAVEYKPGKDVILQRLVVPVYNVPGVLNIEIEAKTAAMEEWQTEGKISINASNYASVSAENIEVSKA